MSVSSWPERARELADSVLFPAADSVDADGEIPSSHFEILAAEGFYGLASDRGEPLGPDELPLVVETLCAGCLATTFTWMQHNGVVMSLTHTSNTSLRTRYLDGVIDGSVKAGVAFAGAIPRPPKLYARRTDTGYVLDGHAPFVTGWGIVDILQVSARDEFDDSIVHLVIPATDAAGIEVERLTLIAVDASNTVRLLFDGVEVDDSQVVSVVTDEEFQSGQIYGSYLNGCMAMGVARRAITQMDDIGTDTSSFRRSHSQRRAAFDDALAGTYDMFAARAEASELAMRAAAALVTATGSGAIVGHGTPERLVREATFTLVGAGRPQIKAELLRTLQGDPAGRSGRWPSDEEWR
ncbi:acyl-CoA dehydrogenase [Rhodococcus sp. 15-1154-1]|nr:acyl-CoA dehydrogenase family protein [Rhodococcus sp. 15-1154-1]OZE97664.1 acyl-CoA dehydrogenase [Rhodococcus sp. 15-1154-1]